MMIWRDICGTPCAVVRDIAVVHDYIWASTQENMSTVVCE